MLIKEVPEDFIVKEKSTVKACDKGEYVYFLLKKRNYNTVDALEQVAKAVHAPVKWFGFAGNKDKRAVTEQVCSAKMVSDEKLKAVSIKDIEIKILGRGDKPISLGDLEGNYFEIIVKDVKKPKMITKFLNYFGEQRFGSNNAEVGRAIVKKDFKKAAYLLGLNPGNPIGELTKINKKVLAIYVNAYQSLLWNEAVKKLAGTGVREVPVIGFGTVFENDEVKKVMEEIMKREEITLRDFIIKQMPDLSSEGTVRKVYCNAEDLEIEEKEGNILLKFFLPKGSYATVFIDELLNQ